MVRSGLNSNQREEAGKHRVIALTNNFAVINAPPSELAFLGWGAGGAVPQHLKELFDDFCDSSTLGMRLVCKDSLTCHEYDGITVNQSQSFIYLLAAEITSSRKKPCFSMT